MSKLLFWAAALLVLLQPGAPAQQAESRPNFIVIFTDDQGWADVGAYGSPDIRTPHLDRMAWEGIKLTSFYAAPFCGPSRAALMTGCYPARVSLAFNHSPKATTGIHPDEITIAELLKQQGYGTMIVGKWHLGDAPEFLPQRHGFDHYFGIPFSNDMWRYHPRMPLHENEDKRMSEARKRALLTGYAGQGSFYPKGGGFPHPLPLMENDEVVELDPDQTKLTRLYTEKALEFINTHQDQPFFLYLAHSMPHVPLFRSERFKGVSERGLYGDVIEEIDWSMGQILQRLKDLNLDKKTLVVFTSDNGPWLQYGIDGGSAGPLRSGKGTTWEGGMRVPGIARWPGRIPSRQISSEIVSNMDLLPTFAALAGAAPVADRVIDGKDIWPILSGQAGARSPYEAFYFFAGSRPDDPPNLRAIRVGPWKLHLEKELLFEGDRFVEGVSGAALYDLSEDVGEKFDRKERHPDVVERLRNMAVTFLHDLESKIRPLGRLPKEGIQGGAR